VWGGLFALVADMEVVMLAIQIVVAVVGVIVFGLMVVSGLINRDHEALRPEGR
jgi:hypothetical protein